MCQVSPVRTAPERREVGTADRHQAEASIGDFTRSSATVRPHVGGIGGRLGRGTERRTVTNDPEPPFDYQGDLARNQAESAFLRRLADHCRAAGGRQFDVWDFYPQLVVTLSLSEPGDSTVPILRTLRVDLEERRMVGGEDPGGQIDPDLDASANDFFEIPGPLSPEQFADRAYEWFREQGARPIERLEWDGDVRGIRARLIRPVLRPPGWRVWVLRDEGRLLVCQRDAGTAFDAAGPWLGTEGPPDRPPDRVTPIAPRVL